jgi:Fur family transcriptional regulator, iron response regulator
MIRVDKMALEHHNTLNSYKTGGPFYDWRNGALAKVVRAKLREAALRPTRQRVSLASLLFVAGDRHVTVEHLCNEARALRMPLSRATVYNTLHQFVAAGLLREIALYGSKVWYDTKTGSHCHYYDEDKSLLFDMPTDVAKKLELTAPEGTKIAGVDVIVRLRSLAPEIDQVRSSAQALVQQSYQT